MERRNFALSKKILQKSKKLQKNHKNKKTGNIVKNKKGGQKSTKRSKMKKDVFASPPLYQPPPPRLSADKSAGNNFPGALSFLAF